MAGWGAVSIREDRNDQSVACFDDDHEDADRFCSGLRQERALLNKAMEEKEAFWIPLLEHVLEIREVEDAECVDADQVAALHDVKLQELARYVEREQAKRECRLRGW